MIDSLDIDNVRLANDPENRVSVRVVDGRITAIAAQLDESDRPATFLDGGDALLLPGLVNAHAHLDKTMFGGTWVPNPGLQRVDERIAYERRTREQHGLPNEIFIGNLVEQLVATGTTHVRSHTDIDPGVGLQGVEAVNGVAKRFADRIDIQQVAFPQGGLISNPGTVELLEEATKHGVEVIGAIDPAGFDQAPIEQLDAIFDLAARTGTRIDIHLHDEGSLGAWEFGQIIDRTVAQGMSGRVAISHAFGIDHLPTQATLIDRLAEAGVALVTAAIYSTPVPPLMRLRAAGAVLASGTDGIHDLWGPYGNGDMLQRVNQVAHRSSLRTDEELEAAFETGSYAAASVLGLDDYGLELGCWADFVLVDARSIPEAVATVPERRQVIKRGHVVA